MPPPRESIGLQTIEALKRRLESSRELHSVVRTMKALAAVKIRQFEKAAEALEDYEKTVGMGLQVVMRNRPGVMVGARGRVGDRVGAIVFGSDQGMCGQLNDQIASYALEGLADFPRDAEHRMVVAVGERIAARLEDRDQPVEKSFSVPNSISGVTPKVHDLLAEIESWNKERGINRVLLFYSEQISGANYRPRTVRLLPADRHWLEGFREKEWPTRSVPTFTMDWDPLFSALVREYLFVSLFRALAESLASENASRLASMQGAEKNIREHIDELQNHFHQRRQMAITEELLDIVSGFEALKEDGASPE